MKGNNASSIAQSSETDAATFKLNVVVHGLWAIETNDNGMRLVTVENHHHVIKAGQKHKPEFDLGKTGGKFKLLGVKEGLAKDLDKTKNPSMSKQDAAAADFKPINPVKVIVELPYPEEILSVRITETRGENFFEGLETPREIASVQIFVYEVEDPNAVKLEGTDFKPIANQSPNDKTFNLHLYAQPPTKDIPGHHFQESFLMLSGAYGLKIKPLRASNPPATDPKVPGLKEDDMLSLFELEGGPILSPANCDSLYFDNTVPKRAKLSQSA